ncbi:MAG: hypothetical protein ABIJ61_06170, partial [bacterium]
MQVDLVTSEERFAKLREPWNLALPDDQVESCWLSHEWLSSWWRAFGEESRMFCPVIWEEEQLTLAAPLLLRERRIKGFKIKTLEFMENGITPRSAFVGSGFGVEEIVKMLEELARRSRLWSVAILENIEIDNACLDAIRIAASEVGFNTLEEPSRNSPFVDLSRGWDDFVANLGEKMRNTIRRRRRRLAELGNVEVERIADRMKYPAALKKCFEI